MLLSSGNGKLQKKFDELLVACRKNLKSVDENLIRKAFEFSLDAHKYDMRASGEPYFHHPYEVAKIVANEIPLDDISVASALLHDVAEDTEYEVKDVRAEFGDTVGDIVDGVTKITDIFRSHEVTQAENYRKLLLSMVNDIRVMLVKFADRLHNMRTLEYLSADKQQRLAKETLEIYAPFAHRFGLAKIKWELEDLAFKYLYRKDYEELTRAIRAKRREREHFIKKFVSPIEKRLKEEGFKFEISGRPKHLYSIYNKMMKRGKPLEEIYDLFAVRIILDTENNNDCFGAYGVVTAIYIPIPERFKNYISVPKKNGYQSIHTTVVGPEGKMIEVQIRTRLMHEVAEKGVAAHWKYKENIEALEEELENWVNWVREIFDRPDEEAPAQQLMESFKLNLYQDEIYVFTPKGDLKILPKGATPLDFAFEIHSTIGLHCIGAKVNGRLVPLNAILRSGDQIEIITSKNQTPSADWEKYVITHKAKSNIRKWLKEEKRKLVQRGKDLWEKKLKKQKLHVNDDELAKFLRTVKIDNAQDFYRRIGKQEIDVDGIVQQLKERGKAPSQVERQKKEPSVFTSFIRSARDSLGGILVLGHREDFMHQYAKCCNPIPGDEIIGYVTTGEGLKIHRKQCKNVETLRIRGQDRLVEVGWPETNGAEFLVGVRVSGEDRPKLLNDITNVISNYNSTNIRGVNIDSDDKMFDGTIILYVKNTDHLQRLIERIRKVKGVLKVERFVEANEKGVRRDGST